MTLTLENAASAENGGSTQIPTPAELIRRAEEIAPTLLSRIGETEKRGYYAQDTHDAFLDAGFCRILAPRELGGYGYGIDVYTKVVTAIARACPSTAWCMCFGAAHAINICTMYEQDLWPEIIESPDFISPLTVKPQGELVEQEDGSWLLSGTYDYCSGAPYATAFSSQAIPVFRDGTKGKPVTFVAHRKDWEFLDNWGNMLGLNGSGSQSLKFVNARIEDRFVIHKEVLTLQPDPRDPENPKHGDNPAYYGRYLSFLGMEPAAVALGALKGALDYYADQMKKRTTMRPPIGLRSEDSDYRRWYGTVLGQASVAESLLNDITQRWMESARLNMLGEKEFSVEDDIRYLYTAYEVIKICWNAMDTLWFSTGSSSAQNGNRMQYYFREIAAIRNHALNTFTDLLTRDLCDRVLGTPGDGADSFYGNSFKNTGTQR